jgi:RNA polymerase sigma-70 factor (ECF subfamily)
MQEPDPDLIRRARDGDVDAFEDLVRAYQADAWRFARSLTRDAHLADDVTQDAFLRAFRFVRSFRGDSKFSSWLFAIVRNCAMDSMKKAGRPTVEEPPGSSPDHQARVEIQMAIDALKERLREPFLLVEVFGMTYADAAVVLQTKVGTVKSRVFRARQVLIASLADEDEMGETREQQ